jgi:Skp family chaperone for outer membrane proteins
VKKILFGLLAALSVGALVWRGTSVDAQAPAPSPGTAPAQSMRPRIALVNIAQVLKRFDKVTVEGKAVNQRRQYYADQVKVLRDKMAEMKMQAERSAVPAERDRAVAVAKDCQRKLEDLEPIAQKELTEMMDKSLLDVYQNIKSVIEAVAVANNIELVMCYPDASTPEEEKKPEIARLKLQAPALIPYYQRNMDITEVVVVTLNKRYPAPPVATTPTPAPTGVQPTSGFQPAPPVPGKQ